MHPSASSSRAPRLLPALALALALLVLAARPTQALDTSTSQQQQQPPSSSSSPSSSLPPLTLSFSGSGFLALFHAGALAQLQDLGLATRRTPAAGASGGTLVAGISCLGLTSEQSAYVARSLLTYCANRRSCVGDLDRAVRAAVALAVDTAFADAQASGDADAASGSKDAFVQARCSGVGVAYLTKLIARSTSADDGSSTTTSTPRTHERTEAWPVSSFLGRDDFVAAGAASSYIPFFSGSAGFTTFRAAEVMDGGFKEMLPPCPPAADNGASTCVRVSAVVAGTAVVPGLPIPSSDAQISPGKYGALPLSLTPESWAGFALSVPGEEAAAAILQHGRDMALAWAQGAGLVSGAGEGAVVAAVPEASAVPVAGTAAAGAP